MNCSNSFWVAKSAAVQLKVFCESARCTVKCRVFSRMGDGTSMQSVTTLTFKSLWFHLEHMAHREDDRTESKTGEGRTNEH